MRGEKGEEKRKKKRGKRKKRKKKNKKINMAEKHGGSVCLLIFRFFLF